MSSSSESNNCLPMCSLCAKPAPATTSAAEPLKRCAACRTRTYCNKKCQTVDWKLGGHKKHCGRCGDGGGGQHKNAATHRPWCAYLDRDPELSADCMVETNSIASNPRELITTGMNTCMFVVVKTTTGIVGWHASMESVKLKQQAVRRRFRAVTKETFVSGFIVPGEDRVEGTLELKPTCRTMVAMPWTDPVRSRDLILDLLKEFEWYDDLTVLPPVDSYKDFVVFDMAHRRPYAFSNPSLFAEGCSFDAAVDLPELGGLGPPFFP